MDLDIQSSRRYCPKKKNALLSPFVDAINKAKNPPAEDERRKDEFESEPTPFSDLNITSTT